MKLFYNLLEKKFNLIFLNNKSEIMLNYVIIIIQMIILNESTGKYNYKKFKL